jgi:predicted secreted protein
MKQQIKLFAAILLILALGWAIYEFDNLSKVYENGQNEHFKKRVGEKFSIKLYENGSTGYQNCWLNENKCQSVKQVRSKYIRSLRERMGYNGAGGSVKFTFMATKKGIDTIRFAWCPTAREQKDCSAYADSSIMPANLFIIEVIE